MSTLIKSQKKTFTIDLGSRRSITCDIRYDDQCGNGHNSFSITGHIEDLKIRGKDKWECGGCIHDEIAKHFPEFKHLIKWHLMSSDQPMHYVANSLYHASNRDYNGARSSAIWGDATIEDFTEEKLLARLPKLIEDFKKDIEAIGFIY
jgi:hypothetical protein